MRMTFPQAASVALIAVALFCVAFQILGGEEPSLVMATVDALTVSVPGVLIGAGLYRLVRRLATKYLWMRLLSAIGGGAASLRVYDMLLSIAKPHDTGDGWIVYMFLWIGASFPMAFAVGAAFGAGWGQTTDSR